MSKQLGDGAIRSEGLVKVSLAWREFAVEIDFGLCDGQRKVVDVMCTNFFAELVLDVTLDTTKHKRLENHVESTQLMLVETSAAQTSSTFDVFGEPFGKLVVRVEKTRHDKVKEGPEFCA